MIFDARGEPGSPERRRARYVEKVLINGAEMEAGLIFYVDTDVGEVRRIKSRPDGSPLVEVSEDGQREFATETIVVDPCALKLIPREDCPAEVRW